MDRDQEYRCATEYVKTRDPLLAERLVVANLRLVVKIAKGYRRAHCDMRDLVQEGNLGLLHAVERFDPDRGVKLCSYAAWWIRAYILKYTIENWRLVKTGTTQAQRRLFFRLQKERSKFEGRGVAADTKEIAATLRVKEEEVTAMMERFNGSEASLDSPPRSRERDARTLGDSLSAASSWQPDVRLEKAEFDEKLRLNLKKFSEGLHGRDREIFRRRLLNEEPVTLVTLAARFGVTRERARQLEFRLKTRIREYLENDLGDAIQPERLAA
jgi:RNA polymerase sigma-32 factor